MGTDWADWHRDYADPGSPLSRRLALVRSHIDSWLDRRPEPLLRVVSACAGQGHDLLGVLAGRADADRVQARLIEYDPRNAAAARAGAAGLAGVEVLCADAGGFGSYAGAVPADLVLMAGVFGNVSDDDVRATVAALPSLCAPGATVIWTRTRRAPDLTPVIDGWFTAAGFVQRAFHAPDDVLFTVGVHEFTGAPRPLPAGGTMFRFR
ncbi:SAM-dependent methyltransferase [Catellatospora tritici]|uniref:SAM-dependent methyltransferase n=1 Tax=Catellatospora tritici TaxID=2851566 RepID=UPI001C2D0F07|nr:SAM-dependent methyltransferase [Catellatospora tritici]MBV1850834.1 SAM-dependent methyltransferase [Catellatospora tritici]MBV1851087.1 SAM-dependent methyltransferase [Catellatospora tritici]